MDWILQPDGGARICYRPTNHMLAAALLQHVSQLVSDQLSARGSVRLIPPRPKHDVAPYGIGQRAYRPRRGVCLLVRVHAHLAEVAPEARLEKSAHRPWQRLSTVPKTLDLRSHARGDLRSLSR